MGKVNGKKLKKGQKIKVTNVKKVMKKKKKVKKVKSAGAAISALAPSVDPAQMSVSASATDGSGASSQAKENDRDNSKRLAGFIFMCNGKTKPQCYQYRVFGLPMGKKEVVERIKPGMKLFLFDFYLKFLYGVYEATSRGNIDLEPTAFEGRFPAQVKFKIFKECLPLPEKSFKTAIQDNYQGGKFKPELDKKQVRSLVSLFPPLSASSSTLVPYLMPNAAPAQIILPRGMEDQYQHSSSATVRQHSHISARLLSSDYRYLSAVQHSNALVSQPTREVQIMQHPHYTTAAPVDRSFQAVEHQGYQPASYYNTDSRQPYFATGHTQIVQEPYSRYREVEEVVLRYQPVGLDNDPHRLPLEREGETAMNYQHHLTLLRERETALEGESAQKTAASYHHHLLLPRERENALNRANVAAFYAAATFPVTSTTVQPQALAPGRPQLNIPSSSFYSVSGPARIIR